MSESVAKATRRDLRRAMGSAAVDRVVLHERAIEAHAEALRHLSKQYSDLFGELGKAEAHIGAELGQVRESLERDIKTLEGGLQAVASCSVANEAEINRWRRSLWARLRWLVAAR